MRMWKYSLDEINSAFDEDIDILVCSASFEERCLSFFRSIDRSRVKLLIIGRCEAQPELTKAAYDEFRVSHSNHTTVRLDLNEPLANADAMFAALRGRSEGGRRIVVDISSFTHEMVLVIYRILNVVANPSDRVNFLYVGAQEYSVGDPYDKKWLSRGIKEIRSVVGFPGELLPSRGIHLIVLVGFEHERALSLVREYEPAHVSLGYGDPREESTKPHQATNTHGVACIQRAQSIASEVSEFVFNPYDPELTCDALRKQVKMHEGVNVIVAAMNTKISTIGAARVALELPHVQLCYVQPLLYNHRSYSLPRSDCVGFEFQDLTAI